jgi:hypothetical protein
LTARPGATRVEQTDPLTDRHSGSAGAPKYSTSENPGVAPLCRSASPSRRTRAGPMAMPPFMCEVSGEQGLRLLGLGRPLRRTPFVLSDDRAARPLDGDGSAGITPPCTTTSRLTPRRASVCLSRRVIASPTRPPPSRPPGHTWTTGHPRFGHDDVCKDCSGPYEVSLDHLINNFRCGPPKSPPGAPTSTGRS